MISDLGFWREFLIPGIAFLLSSQGIVRPSSVTHRTGERQSQDGNSHSKSAPL